MMSEMARDFFGNNPALSGPLIAMLLFSVVFVAAVLRAFKTERSHVDRLAHLPLEGEETSDVSSPDQKEACHG